MWLMPVEMVIQDFLSKGEYLSFLEEALTPRRLEHSIQVMEVMIELTPIYDLVPERAMAAGLLHDAAKDLSPSQQEQLIRDAGIHCYYECDHNYLLYLHGPVGAAFLERELGIEDPLLLAAIESHTSYGNTPYFDHPLCWCLRFADVLEPTRNWRDEPTIREHIHLLRKFVFEGRMSAGIVYQTSMLMRWFKEKGFPIHPNMIKANTRFAKKRKAEERSFTKFTTQGVYE